MIPLLIVAQLKLRKFTRTFTFDQLILGAETIKVTNLFGLDDFSWPFLLL